MTPGDGARAVSRRLAVIVAACAAWCVGVAGGLEMRLPWWVGIVGVSMCVVVAAASVVWRGPRALLIVACVGAVAGFGLTRGVLAGVSAAHDSELARALPGAGTVVGVVRDAPVARRGESVVVLRVERTSGEPSASGAVAFAVPGRTDLLPGDELSVSVSHLRAPDSRPGPLSEAALDRQGVDAVAVSPRVTVLARGGATVPRELARARSAIAGEVAAAAPEPQATLLDALAFGIHQPLPADVSRPLQYSGLAHLEATSGLKVAIVAGLVAHLLALLAAGPRARLTVTLTTVAAYVVVAGGGAAAVRSAVMAVTVMGLSRSGRRIEPVVLLGLVAAGMLLVDPRLCGDVGFQLSFLGTLGIVLGADRFARRIPGPRLLADTVAVTLAAQLATLPVQGAAFGVIALVGPFANALAIPLIPPIVVLAWAGVALAAIAAPLGAPLVWAASALTGTELDIARLTASVPGGTIRPPAWPASWTVAATVVTIAVGLAWWTLGRDERAGDRQAFTASQPAAPRSQITRRRGRGPAVVACALAAGVAVPVIGVAATRPDGRLHVSVLDVGAGPAVLVRVPAGGLALVDAGPDPARLLASLGAVLPPLTHTIDVLVLTGGERAATAGLADLASHYAIGRVVVPDADLGTAGRAAVLALRDVGADVVTVPVGAPWRWDGAVWRCVGPAPPADPTGPVAPVCALQVSDGAASALLLGDLPSPAQEELAGLEGSSLRSQLVVAPPNGLVAASLIDAAAPRVVAIPCARAPRVSLTGIATRTTAASGTLRYDAGPDGLGAAP